MTEARSALHRLLTPASVAVVGLSADPSRHGARIVANLRKFGFTGEIRGVNTKVPAHGAVLHDTSTVQHLDELPVRPDAVVFAVPATVVPGLIGEAVAAGAAGGVLIGGGYAEAGAEGSRRQDEVMAAARRSGFRLLGPNSAGIIDAGRRTVVSFLTCLERPAESLRSGPVALISQSGGSVSYLVNLAAERESGFAVAVSMGNEADVTAEEALALVLDRPDVRAVALILEVIRDGEAFARAARRAAALGKPLVVARIGTSAAGATVVRSHTGALASDARRFAAYLEGLGVTLVDTPEQLLDVAEMLARAPLPGGAGVGVVTHSGGTAGLLADALSAHAVPLPQPGPELRERLGPLLQYGAAHNPTDLGGIITEPARFADTVSTYLADGSFPTVLAVTTPHPGAHTMDRVERLVELGRACDRPLLHLWLGGDLHRDGLAALRRAGAPVTTHVDTAARVVAALAGFAAFRARTAERRNPDRRVDLPRSGSGRLTEAEAKRVAASLGVAVPRGTVVTTAAEAARAAAGMGFPVVVKRHARELVHKSEAGGVVLDLRTPQEVVAACEQVAAAAGAGAAVEYLVEEYRPGMEAIVGTVNDPRLGPFVLVGLGGVHAEAMDDVRLALAPVTVVEAERLIRSLRGFALLDGFRGAPPTDVPALARLVAAVSELAWTARDVLVDFELNPVVHGSDGWTAVDAVARVRTGS